MAKRKPRVPKGPPKIMKEEPLHRWLYSYDKGLRWKLDEFYMTEKSAEIWYKSQSEFLTKPIKWRRYG